MGLKLRNVSLESGIEVETSYIRIDTVNGSKDELTISANYYIDKQASDDGKPLFKYETYNFHPSVADDSPNFIKQGYEYLKTLPEFSEALDA